LERLVGYLNRNHNVTEDSKLQNALSVLHSLYRISRARHFRGVT